MLKEKLPSSLNVAARSVSSTLRTGRELAMRLISLLGIVLLLTSATHASTILKITNSTTMSITYDVSGKVTDDQGHDLGSFVDTITLKPKDMATYGGDTGLAGTKGREVKDTKVFKGTVQIASLIPVLDFSAVGAVQIASILQATDNTSNVFSYFDFGTPTYTELVANTDFTFAGFDVGGRIPILDQVGTGTRITTSTGQLLPQFQFTGPTTEVGIVQSPVPEPSPIWLLFLGLGGLALLGRRIS